MLSSKQLANGRFELLRLIGQGGMGRVYHAYDRELELDVALKTMRAVDAAAMLRFKTEFRALTLVHHPNLVQLYELVGSGLDWFFTMELLEAVDFLTYVRDQPALPTDAATASLVEDTLETQVIAHPALSSGANRRGVAPPAENVRLREALHQLALGIAALHGSGHLHRDIKPSNVLVTTDGRVVLVDLGIAASIGEFEASQSLRECVGTPAYMAPEQASRRAAIGEGCDWYAVGVILYEALTGRRPFTGKPRGILAAKAKGSFVPPSHWRPDVDPKLEQLCTALLSPHPAGRPGTRQILRAVAARASKLPDISEPKHAFVGRARELARLHELFSQARESDGLAVFVSGHSGMGKTALVQTFLHDIAEHDAVVLTGRCYERESVPYKALDSLIDTLCYYLLRLPPDRIVELLPDEIHALATAFPVLRRIPAVVDAQHVAGPVAPDPLELRRRAFSALRSLFRSIARERPLVIAIDDLQWGDLDSAGLIADLVRGLSAPVMFIGSYRREDEDHSELLSALLAVAAVVADGQCHRLPVTKLRLVDATKLAARLLGAEADRALAERVARASDGNPFFLQELARYVSSSQYTESLQRIGLDTMLARRIAQLRPDVKRLIELVALAGKPIAIGIVRRAAELEQPVPQALAELRELGLARTSGSRDADRVEPYHDRVREAIWPVLDEPTRAAYHRALAREIESANGNDYESLAVHYAGAGARNVAFGFARRAADAANAALAFERAATLYALARSLAPRDDPDGAAALAEAHARALANAGRAADAGEAYRDAASLSSGQRAAELGAAAGAELLRGGHVGRGLEVLQPVLEEIGLSLARSPRRALISALYRRFRVRLHGLRYTNKAEDQVAPSMLARIDAHWKVAGALGMMDTVRGADAQAQHVLLAVDQGDSVRVGRALALEVAYTCLAGASARGRVERLLADVERIATRSGDRLLYAVGNSLAGLACYQRGEFSKCLQRARESEAILRNECTGASWEETSAQLYLAWSLYWAGEMDLLREHVDDFVARARDRGDRFAVVSLTTGVPGFHLIARGDIDRARASAQAARNAWPDGYHLQHYWAHFTNVCCDLYQGDAALALRQMNEQVRALRKSFLYKIAMVRFEARHLRGRCALAAACGTSGAQRRRWLSAAARDARAVGRQAMGPLRPLGGLLAAGVARQRGKLGRARSLLSSAEESLQNAGVGLFAAAAAYQLGRLEGERDGTERVAAALQRMKDAAVADPERLADLMVPGFSGDIRMSTDGQT